MKFFLFLLFLILILVGGWSGYIYWRDQSLPNQEDIEWFDWRFGLNNELNQQDIVQNLPQSISVDYFAENASQAAQKAANIMESTLRSSENPEKPITQQALDYARYQYCKQVIEEYEKLN